LEAAGPENAEECERSEDVEEIGVDAGEEGDGFVKIAEPEENEDEPAVEGETLEAAGGVGGGIGNAGARAYWELGWRAFREGWQIAILKD
jgi:hypothetical protein